jgi:multimeric flavodoxin WrbA
MKILGISGSTRSEDTSGVHTLVKTTLEATGLDYELVTLRGKKISGCLACCSCVGTNICVINDDMRELREKIVEADGLVIGAPNFYGTLNSTTHAFLERFYQFRHKTGKELWGKLGVAIGVGGSTGAPVAEAIENFMSFSFIETVAKVYGNGAASCFTCGSGESCEVGVVQMLFGKNAKITEEITPNVNKQPEALAAAKAAGALLATRLTNNHDKMAVAEKMKLLLMAKYKQSD